jgi:hypothetical protein
MRDWIAGNWIKYKSVHGGWVEVMILHVEGNVYTVTNGYFFDENGLVTWEITDPEIYVEPIQEPSFFD